jgi:hypothetical protein
LQQLASHGLFDVYVQATGDTHIDDHHSNEDIALAIGTVIITVGTNSTGVPQLSPKHQQKPKPVEKIARSTGCLDRTPAPTRTRSARRGASTAPRLRLVRGPLDGVPRPRSGSDSYEARSTGHLDHAPAPRRPFFTYPGQKP